MNLGWDVSLNFLKLFCPKIIQKFRAYFKNDCQYFTPQRQLQPTHTTLDMFLNWSFSFSLAFDLKYFNWRIKMQGTTKSEFFPISTFILMKVILLEYLYREFESEIRSQIMFVQKLCICIEHCCRIISKIHNIYKL